MPNPPRRDHLRACEVHGTIGGGAGGSGLCPACATDVDIEVRRDDVLRAKPLDLQWAVESETLVELIPLVLEYLEDRGEGPAWLAMAEVRKRMLPAGYTEQERWFNVLRYRFGSMDKTIMREENARETIETLRGEGYGGG